MIKRNIKYKIGDKVRIEDSGSIYHYYYNWPGISESDRDKKHPRNQSGERGVIISIDQHRINKSKTLALVKLDKNGKYVVINVVGLLPYDYEKTAYAVGDTVLIINEGYRYYGYESWHGLNDRKLAKGG